MEEKNTITTINNKKMPDDRSSGTLLNISQNEFILIGGGNREKTFNDIWHLRIEERVSKNYEIIWSEINIKSNLSFQPRFGTAGVKINTEEQGSSTSNTSTTSTIWLHGGQNYFENKHYADMTQFKFNISNNNNNCSQIIPELLSNKNHTNYPLDITSNPRERNSHCLIEIDKERLFLFGGGSQEGLLNDLWQFNHVDQKWSKCELKGDEIIPREMHGVVCYTTTTSTKKENYLYIFGGRLYESIECKVYRINLSTFKSEYVCDIPIPLCSFSFVNYKHFIIIYGGTDGVTFFNDIIIFNIISQKWAKSKIQINADFINNDVNLMGFLGRIGSMMALDHITENLVIFGGSSLHKDTNYTYVVNLKDLLDENNLIPFI